MRMKGNRVSLRLVSRKRFGSHLEIGNDGFEQGIPVLYYNSRVEALAFNNGTGSTNGETIRSSMSLEPCKKQAITICLATIAVVAHIKKYVEAFCKENVEYSQNSQFNLGVMWRTLFFQLLNNKLKSGTTANRLLCFKRNQVVDAKISGKDKITIRGIRNLVWGFFIDKVKGKFYHNETIVPFSPISLNSSAMRFSAARLISNECLKRASASSYVTFFASIINRFLHISAAKISIISETTMNNAKNICP